MKNLRLFVFVLAMLISLSIISGALNVSLSDQGTEIKTKSNDELVDNGDLRVEVWDSLTGGNLIYNETFDNAISDGSWNVMLGENSSNPLTLEFGKKYYRDYYVNGEDVDFTNLTGQTVERQFFYSPLGDVSGEDVDSSANFTISSLNASLVSYFKDAVFNGGWENNGVSILEGDIYAQTGFFYNITSLNVTKQNLTINDNFLAKGNTILDQNLSVDTNTLFVDSNNNRVGIGNTNPGELFEVGDTASANLVTGNAIVIGDSNEDTHLLFGEGDSFDWGWIRWDRADDDLHIYTRVNSVNNDNQLVLDSSGRVGIGTASPTQNLDVRGNINVSDTLILNPQTSPTSSNEGGLFFNTSSKSLMINNGSKWLGLSGVPEGTISAFENSCPTGWQEHTGNNQIETADAWVNFDGTSCSGTGNTCIIRDSFNVDNVTNITNAGHYRIYWDSDFLDSNYSLVFSGSPQTNINDYGVTPEIFQGYAEIRTRNTAGQFLDTAYLGVVAFGNSTNQLTYCQKIAQDTQESESFWGKTGSNLFVQNTSLNVGIGTSSPSSKLHLSASTGDQNVYNTVDDTTGNVAYWLGNNFTGTTNWGGVGLVKSDSSLRFSTTGSFSDARMTILNDGKVGIGTTNPAFKLVVNGTAKIGNSEDLNPPTDSQLKIDGNQYTGHIALNETAMYLGHNSGIRDFILQTDETDAIFIDGGNQKVGIGTTGPNNELDVSGDIGASRIVLSLSSPSSGHYITVANNAAGFPNQNTNENVCYDQSDGGFTQGGTDNSCSTSSKRYKQNITELGYGLKEVMELKPSFFYWKEDYMPEDRRRKLGFIAEDVEKVIPELIEYMEINGTMMPDSVAYDYAVPLNTKAIQELNSKHDKEIQELREENEVMKNCLAVSDSFEEYRNCVGKI